MGHEDDGDGVRVVHGANLTVVNTPVGVGPHPEPWPVDPRFDPELLAGGDTRNVADRYRYWTVEAIVADLDPRRHPFEVAIENWAHDMNIGTVVRNANAFAAAAVHIVGRRRWNRRGAMVTDRYQHVHHHPDVESLAADSAERGLTLWGIDNLAGSTPIETAELPVRLLMLFGQEGPGLSDEAGRGRSAWSTSPSSDRPGRSMPAWHPASRCTRGSVSTRS